MINLEQLEDLAKAVVADPIQNGTSLTPDYMRLLDEANPAVILELIETQRMLIEALNEARNGLLWYQEACFEMVSETDHETMARIDAAIQKATGESS